MKKKQEALFTQITSVLNGELRTQLTPVGRLCLDSGVPFHLLTQYLDLFDGITPKDVAIINQLMNLGKRFVGSGSTTTKKERDDACWEKFRSINEVCAIQNERIASGDLSYLADSCLTFIGDEIQKLYVRVVNGNGPLVETNIGLLPISGFAVGPGSVNGVKGISPIEKYEEAPITCSTYLGMRVLRQTAQWHKPLNDIIAHKGEMSRCESVKATMVDKTSDISRMIVPQLNGDLLCQYPMGKLLEDMLGIIGISLDTQPDLNAEAARKGSLFANDEVDPRFQARMIRYCTVDLTSSSELQGRALCQRVFPPAMFNYMAAVSPTRITRGSETLHLHMMSNMGNAFCFPQQTLIYAMICKFVYKSLGIPEYTKEYGKTFHVFGDDIIIDVKAYDTVIKILEELCMIPNKKKSFSKGLFRESCGGDFYNGYNVRPVFTTTLNGLRDRYSLLNRLLKWSFYHSLNVSATVKILIDSIPNVICTPLEESEISGLQVPETFLRKMPVNWRQRLRISLRVAMGDMESNSHIGGKNITHNIAYHAMGYKLSQSHATSRTPTLFSMLVGGIKGKSTDLWLINTNHKRRTITRVDVPFWDTIDNLFVGNAWRFARNIIAYYDYHLSKMILTS